MFGRAADDWTADISFSQTQKCRAIISYSVFLSDKALLWPVSSGLDNGDPVYWTKSSDSDASRHHVQSKTSRIVF